MSDEGVEPITRAFLRILAETDQRVELPSPRLLELLDAEAERDRLRAVVEAVSEYRTVMKTRTANLSDGSPDLAAEGDLSDRARALNRTIDEALAALDAKEGT